MGLPYNLALKWAKWGRMASGQQMLRKSINKGQEISKANFLETGVSRKFVFEIY